MTYLILPEELLAADMGKILWRLSAHFIKWCDENFKEPYSFSFVRSAGYTPFSRYQRDCYMLLAADDDAALVLLRYPNIAIGDPDEDVEENKADFALFR